MNTWADKYASIHYEYFRTTVGCDNLAILFEIPRANIVLMRTNHLNFGVLWEYNDLPELSLNLPDEVCDLVLSFVGRKFSVMFEFRLPPDYPFRAPIWVFDEEINATLAPTLAEALRQKVLEHNCQNEEGWSPALKFEKDILNFSVRVSELI